MTKGAPLLKDIVFFSANRLEKKLDYFTKVI